MLRITQIRLPVSSGSEDIRAAAAKRLGLSSDSLVTLSILRRSVDARKKPDIFFNYTLAVSLEDEKKYLRKKLPTGVSLYDASGYVFPYSASDKLKERPLIIGTGPAGLFCALELALHGFRPLVVERGDEVDTRIRRVSRFWDSGELDPESNVQFGEGGAGTFSDGKLYTGVHDSSGRNMEVLRRFAEFGAPEEILYDSHAHIGTDVLSSIVKRIREAIISLGGEFRFRLRADSLIIKDGRAAGIRTAGGESICSPVTILAIGHSARDTFRSLRTQNVPMEAKTFAVGLRIRHPQEMIDKAQYGGAGNDITGHASYKLHAAASNGRPVYSFCMCPGGHVINASSSEGMLAVNGMSLHARNSGYANSALVTQITPDECAALSHSHSDGVFAGLIFQEELEKAAWNTCGGAVPAQMLGDFVRGSGQNGRGEIDGVKGEARWGDLRRVLPDTVSDTIAEGIGLFDRQIRGFSDPGTLLFGVESRTSSPVRILRGPDLHSSIRGLIPAGEGAGYAGGITSAAIDGIRAAEAAAKALVQQMRES